MATIIWKEKLRMVQNRDLDPTEQPSLLTPKELEELRCLSAPRLWKSKKSPYKADGAGKARGTKDNATQPRLPGF